MPTNLVTRKNTSSGPKSSAIGSQLSPLGPGATGALSMVASTLSGRVLSAGISGSCNGMGQLGRVERAQIVDCLADADGVDGQAELLRRRDQHAAARRAVQL